MQILVANLGSTSFKFKMLDASNNFAEVAKGGYERIGHPAGDYASHADVIDVILASLPTPPDAIGFKAVHGGPIGGAARVTEDVIATMQQFADVAPAHNPVYIAAMRSFQEKLPNVPHVAAFETAFHATIPQSRQVYAIPWEWTETLGIRRYGFHGASHRYVSTRVRELVPAARRVISCHLGGSSSVCAVIDGHSVATSMGLTPQTGLPQNNRVGDFDAFALLKLTNQGLSVDEILGKLGKESGLLGISGVSNDMRDIERAADANPRARLAIECFVESVRSYIGSYLVALGGVDVIAFTGGIGENAAAIRAAICKDLDFVGVSIDENKNDVRGTEAKISSDDSKSQVWVVPTNEELVVAKQTVEVLGRG